MLDRIAAILIWLALASSLLILLPTVQPFPNGSAIAVTFDLIGTGLAFIDPFVDTYVLLQLTGITITLTTVSLIVLIGFWFVRNWKN